MTVLTEGRHAGEAIVWEADIRYTRENITILEDEVVGACAVLGRTLDDGEAVATAYAINAANTGAMGTVTVTGPAKVGMYRLTIIEPASNAGKYEVVGPDGIAIGTGNVAAAFSAGGLAFTLADGSTDFSSGEGFTIAVTGDEKYAEWDPDATNGAAVAAAILFEAVDATGADSPGVATVRGPALFNSAELGWITGASDDEKAAAIAQLKALGIIVR